MQVSKGLETRDQNDETETTTYETEAKTSTSTYETETTVFGLETDCDPFTRTWYLLKNYWLLKF
jgi:hypothetical protein